MVSPVFTSQSLLILNLVSHLLDLTDGKSCWCYFFLLLPLHFLSYFVFVSTCSPHVLYLLSSSLLSLSLFGTIVDFFSSFFFTLPLKGRKDERTVIIRSLLVSSVFSFRLLHWPLDLFFLSLPMLAHSLFYFALSSSSLSTSSSFLSISLSERLSLSLAILVEEMLLELLSQQEKEKERFHFFHCLSTGSFFEISFSPVSLTHTLTEVDISCLTVCFLSTLFCLCRRFDILVNGGSMVTLQFQRAPFLPIKRTVLVPWNEIVVIQSPIVMSASNELHLPLNENYIQSTSNEVNSLLSTLLVSPDPFLVKYPHSTLDNGTVDSSVSPCYDHNYDMMKPMIIERETSGEAGTATQESAGISETQSLIESLTIPSSSGVKLTYRSSLASGYLSILSLQLTTNKISPKLKLIHLRVIVEGNLFGKVFEPDENIRYTFSWNKRNVYRQKVYGLTTAKGNVILFHLISFVLCA